MKEKMKPKMPEKAIQLKLNKPLSVELLCDLDNYSSGHMLMQFSDTMATVSEKGEKVGTIGAAMGGSIFVEIHGRLWSVNLTQLWEAAREADARYLKGERG
jgi:hypothetical protein